MLSPDERETTILWSDAEETATVYTHDKRLKARLRELSAKYPEQFYSDPRRGGDPCYYIVPKSCFSLRAPFDEERKQKLSRQAREQGRRPPVRKKR